MTALTAAQLDELEAFLNCRSTWTELSWVDDPDEDRTYALHSSTLRALLELAHRAHFLAEAHAGLNNGEFISMHEHKLREAKLLAAIEQVVEVAP